MSLIDHTYFFGDFNIGQKSSDPVKNKIGQYISAYESEYLDKALGADFAHLVNVSTSDPRFDTLEEMLTEKPSPIAGYVFCKYQKSEVSVASGSGDITVRPENSTRSPESYRMRVAWNLMVNLTRKIHKYLLDNAETFPEFRYCDINRSVVTKTNDFGI